MITKKQVEDLTKKYKTNETTVFREYLQILFLSRLYSFSESKKVFFKGGTCLHLIYKAPRFSEDLDFTVELSKKEFDKFIKKIFDRLSKEGEIEFKERKTIAGKRFLLTASPSILPFRVFVNLDFSFREKVFDIKKSIVASEYPILFDSYVYHLSKKEILAEKIRAILSRKKGRDLYDLWFLLNKDVFMDDKLVKQKLRYYKLERKGREGFLKRIKTFSKKDFVLDLRPFVPINERQKLGDFFDYVKDFLEEKL